jgi:hypothetical protein
MLEKSFERVKTSLMILIGHSDVLLKLGNFQQIALGHKSTQLANQLNMLGNGAWKNEYTVALF